MTIGKSGESMYEYMVGTVVDVQPSYLVLQVGGVGYHLLMANPFRLNDRLGQEVKIYLYLNVSQDQLSLFGFPRQDEKSLFLKLINVSGIGPKSALAILANEDHAGLIQAIENEDRQFLQRFPGVGKKTASQIVLDLKGNLQDLTSASFPQSSAEAKEAATNPALEEALLALEALGYSKREVKKVKKALEDQDDQTSDAYIRQGLDMLLHQ